MVAVRLKVNVPSALGVPASTPVCEFRDKPVGSVPLEALRRAPLASKSHEKLLPTSPGVGARFVNVGGTKVNCADAVAPPFVFSAKASDANVKTFGGTVTEAIRLFENARDEIVRRLGGRVTDVS